MTTGEQEGLTEKAIYFLRLTDPGKAVNMGDTDGDVLFGEIHPNILEQLNLMMTYSFQPLIEKLDQKYWGECDQEIKSEFIQMTNNFSKELDENLNSMSKNLDRCKLDHEHIKSLNNETAKLNHYEAQF